MNENLQIAALASTAATALVSEMAKDSWKKMREIAARLFFHGGEDEMERQLCRLDADQTLALKGETSRIQDRWNRRLITFVEDHFDSNPEILSELNSIASEAKHDSSGNGVSIQASQIQGSNFQMGGSNNASINLGGSDS